MTYNLTAVRKLLRASFSSDEINVLAFDLFPDLAIDLPDSMTRSEKIKHILNYAKTRGAVPEIVAYVQRENPFQYQHFAAQLEAPPTSTTADGTKPQPDVPTPASSVSDNSEREEDIRRHLETHLALLEAFEKQLALTEDADKAMRLEKDIAYERSSIARYQQELEALKTTQPTGELIAKSPESSIEQPRTVQTVFQEVRHELISVVSRLPVSQTFNGRSSLLYGIPDTHTMNRDANLLQHDIDLITRQLAERSPLANGNLPLIEFLSNAILYASGTVDIEQTLKTIQQKLESV